MKNIHIEKILGILMLIFAVGFNLWLYRLEPTATIDPNDNTFQFALVDRANTVWDFASRKCLSTISGTILFPICHFSYMSDHWVHNWAAGYNLPYYYSHIPQIVMVGSWRVIVMFVPQLTLFQWYHVSIYLLLCFFPLSIFLALRVIRPSANGWLMAGIGGILATNLSTDGLYGLDPSSFLWRGYGLSSQLFAMIWLPLALAYAYKFFVEKSEARSTKSETNSKRLENSNLSSFVSYFDIRNSNLLLAVIFSTATTAGHLGIGMITMLSLGFLAIASPVMKILQQESLRNIWHSIKDQILRLSLVAGLSIFLLSYWILPTFIHGNFHNISFWDPVWKFNSYGAKETLIRLFNGDLFDFGRLPIITYLTVLGVIVGLLPSIKSNSLNSELGIVNSDKNKNHNSVFSIQYSQFSFLFIFWLLFYFGRTTWGGLIDLIPGMKDFHLSRFLVGVHVAGMLLAPIGFSYLVSRISDFVSHYVKHWIIGLFVYLLIGLLLIPPVYRWTITYNDLNNRLIVQAIGNHAKVKEDEQKLFAKLRSLPPARIFAGRGGSFGKRFEVAETPYYMHLSTYGLPTSLWLPETWSMNSDTEQYFSEDQAKDYDLYNLRWVAAPPDEPAKPFWKLIEEADTWKLYEVATSGYFTTGVRPATISIGKQNFMTLVHLWIQSDMHKNGLFPELTFDKHYPKSTGIPNFKMLDEVTYLTPDGKKHNIWTEPPVYLPPGISSTEQFNKLTNQQIDNNTPKSWNNIKIIGPEKVDTDMIYSTTVEVDKNCVECLVILKQTYHPNWKAYIDGKRAKTIITFPFFIGVPVTEGTHEITLKYEPSPIKTLLFTLALISIAGYIIYWRTTRKSH